MTDLFDSGAPKKSANLSINSDLLTKSKNQKINLSATLEQALTEKLAAMRAATWQKDNARAIQAYNDFVEENGCFGDEFRGF